MSDGELAHLVTEIKPRSQLVVPMRARGRVVGCLLLVMADSRRRFEHGDLPRFQELADRLGLMTDNAILFAAAGEARRQAEMTGGRLEVLQQATAGAAQALTVEEVLGTPSTPGLLHSAPLRDGWRCQSTDGVELLHEKWWGVGAGHSPPGSSTISEASVRICGAHRQAALVPQCRPVDPAVSGGPASCPGGVLLDRRRAHQLGPGTVGALGAGFSQSDLLGGGPLVLAALAAVTARSMERARRYEEQHDAAQTLQQSLLPRILPRVPWLTPRPVHTGAGADRGGWRLVRRHTSRTRTGWR